MFTHQICKSSRSYMFPCLHPFFVNGYFQRHLHYLSSSFSFNVYQNYPCRLLVSPFFFQVPFRRLLHSEIEEDSQFDLENTMGSLPCRAKYPYNDPSNPKALSFEKGDHLIATHRRGAWWFGTFDPNSTQSKDKGKNDKGWFPGDYVSVNVCAFYPECSKRSLQGFNKCQEHLNNDWNKDFKKVVRFLDPQWKELDDQSKVKQTAVKEMKKDKKIKTELKVYTKTGDTGTTSLFNSQRVSKTFDYFEALGNTDELNAQLGMCIEYIKDSIAPPQNCKVMCKQIHMIQRCLLDVGSHVATPLGSSSKRLTNLTKFEEDNVEHLEKWIDDMDLELPRLKEFILPSGGYSSASLHLARTKARRAERSVVPLFERGDIDEVVQKYLNRLSDYFFVCARFIALKENEKEMTYKKARGKDIDPFVILQNANFKDDDEFFD